jgi:hypothetical protein
MPTLTPWAECDLEEAPAMTDGIWSYVPLYEVARVLASHGGLLMEDVNHA